MSQFVMEGLQGCREKSWDRRGVKKRRGLGERERGERRGGRWFFFSDRGERGERRRPGRLKDSRESWRRRKGRLPAKNPESLLEGDCTQQLVVLHKLTG
jgi:hypothetical protein